jgi:hypothetical protein
MVNNILLIASTITCCLLFNKIYFKTQVLDLKKSYISTFELLKSKGKTELIIAESLKQMKIIGIIILKIILILIPFLIFAVYIFKYNKEGLRIFLSASTNLIIVITAILYYFIKKHVLK